MTNDCTFGPKLESYCLTRKAEGRIMVFSVHGSLDEAIGQYHNQNLDERGGDWSVFCVTDVVHLMPRSFSGPTVRRETRSYLGGER